jgi:hypothetical protein
MNIEAVSEVYGKLSKDNLYLLEDIYHKDVVFEDSAHRFEGWDQRSVYFASLYSNGVHCDCPCRPHRQVEDTGFLSWTMKIMHPKLNGGQPGEVNGVSQIRFSGDRVIYHRDYFDLGEMLYENIPLLGVVIRNIKQRLGK